MDNHLEEYLALCQRIYERMEQEGSWPWKQDTSETLQDPHNTKHERE